MRLSVLVCTLNRSHNVIPCLDSIAEALSHAGLTDAEIVVTDNGSTDDTWSVLENWAAGSPVPVALQRETRKGASFARNCGLRAARGDLIIWTDDDCRLAPDFITKALELDRTDTEPTFRGGCVTLGDQSDLPICVTARDDARRWHIKKHPNGYLSLGGAFMGANMMMPRSIVDRVGFFDERFGPGSSIPAGEEVDYIFRAYAAGFMIEYTPELIVYHFHGRKTLSEAHSTMRNYSIATGAVHAKHLLRSPLTYLPVIWIAKDALRELIGGTNRYKPEVSFSYRNSLPYLAQGTKRYLQARNRASGTEPSHP